MKSGLGYNVIVGCYGRFICAAADHQLNAVKIRLICVQLLVYFAAVHEHCVVSVLACCYILICLQSVH